jgi:hypothetical protein
MDVARPREHRAFAALYDRMTGPLERAVLSERRAGLLADLAGQVLDAGASVRRDRPGVRGQPLAVATGTPATSPPLDRDLGDQRLERASTAVVSISVAFICLPVNSLSYIA